MVNPTDTGQSDDLGRGSWPGPDIAWFRGILVQRAEKEGDDNAVARLQTALSEVRTRRADY
jgi:hypothetical protein